MSYKCGKFRSKHHVFNNPWVLCTKGDMNDASMFKTPSVFRLTIHKDVPLFNIRKIHFEITDKGNYILNIVSWLHIAIASTFQGDWFDRRGMQENFPLQFLSKLSDKCLNPALNGKNLVCIKGQFFQMGQNGIFLYRSLVEISLTDANMSWASPSLLVVRGVAKVELHQEWYEYLRLSYSEL